MSAKFSHEEGQTKRRFIGIAVILALLGLGAAFVTKKPSEPPRKKPKPVEIVVIEPFVPPPPPPPPPPPEPEKVEEQESEELAEEEPVEVAEADAPGPDEPPDEALGTGLTGDGPNSFGLSSRGDGRPGGGGGGTGGSGASRANFLRGVSTTLETELKRHPLLRNATYDVTLRVRVSADGRVLAISPQPSTGNPSIDRVLANDFVGLRLPHPPPSRKPGVVKTRVKSAKSRA